MVELGRGGRAAGGGFYEYPADGPKHLWPGLREEFGGDNLDVPFEDLKDRLLFIEVLESLKCVDEGVLTSAPDGNIGSIFGIGFPAWTGGVLQFVATYPGGKAGFTARARELAARYGDRFNPPGATGS
jgi:3-hydroxyacyl-CoA dehydrogenase/enoyl-CoA hydratase/3-hydroxybutyryl-CoA epimerase